MKKQNPSPPYMTRRKRRKRLTLARSTLRALTEIDIVAGEQMGGQVATGKATCCGNPETGCKPG
jgi:hypothetical protein